MRQHWQLSIHRQKEPIPTKRTEIRLHRNRFQPAQRRSWRPKQLKSAAVLLLEVTTRLKAQSIVNTNGNQPRRKHRTDPGTKSIWFCVMENWPSTKIKSRLELHPRFIIAMKSPSISAAPRQKKLQITPRNDTSSVSSYQMAVNICSKPKTTKR